MRTCFVLFPIAYVLRALSAGKLSVHRAKMKIKILHPEAGVVTNFAHLVEWSKARINKFTNNG